MMPKTDTLTDAEVVELLATEGMGLPIGPSPRLDPSKDSWFFVTAGITQIWDAGKGYRHWNPLTDLNAIRELLNRLDDRRGECKRYVIELRKAFIAANGFEPSEFGLLNADARTCAMALAEVLRGGKDDD